MGRLLLPCQLEAYVLDYFARGVRRYTGRFPIVVVDKTPRCHKCDVSWALALVSKRAGFFIPGAGPFVATSAGANKPPGSVRLRLLIVGPDLEDFGAAVSNFPLVLLKPSVQDPFIGRRSTALASVGVHFRRFGFPVKSPFALDPVKQLQLGRLRWRLWGGSFEKGEEKGRQEENLGSAHGGLLFYLSEMEVRNWPLAFVSSAPERSASAAREARPLHAVFRLQSIISVQLRT